MYGKETEYQSASAGGGHRKYDIDEDTGVLSYFEDGAIHILIEDDDEMPEEEMHDTVCDTPCEQCRHYCKRHGICTRD